MKVSDKITKHLLPIFSFVTIVSASFSTSRNTNEIQNENKSKPRVVNGQNAQRYEFPFLVSYQSTNGVHFCGGTILTREWILTAAHCLIILESYDTRVVAGMLNQGENLPDVQIVEVYRQIIHPDYPGGLVAAPNDLGLLNLAWPLYWTYAVLPIPLPLPNEEFSGLAWTAGWGYTSGSEPILPVRLQKSRMLLISFTQCANDLLELVGMIGPLSKSMICGRGSYTATGSETICKGDSGGPLVKNGKVIGITSWTLEPCGHLNVPSVYTKVSKFLNFIRFHVSGV